MTRISITVDGIRYDDDVEARTLLVHHLRDRLGKVGTVVGCDTSNCGACTVLMAPSAPSEATAERASQGAQRPTSGAERAAEQLSRAGAAVKSCNVLAVQADGTEITTIEGLAGGDGSLHPVQQAFHDRHALQCGFCTPGMILAAVDLLTENPDPSDTQIREGIEGNLCRCTGYQNIVHAVRDAATALRGAEVAEPASAVDGQMPGTPQAPPAVPSEPESVPVEAVPRPVP
ncbi:(2Fe-2S)-binding protein [Micromonospora sp. CPCC 206061]|uniref:(2Fe-2S)-binding protein n=1 Tax=Micromonospora sp. CPCC 206061 TaxID=3122410 RepID=UPI002FF13F2A